MIISEAITLKTPEGEHYEQKIRSLEIHSIQMRCKA